MTNKMDDHGLCWHELLNVLQETYLYSQPPSITVEFSVQYNLKITSVIYYLFIVFSQQLKNAQIVTITRGANQFVFTGKIEYKKI